ncbi:uncharacterized protein LOC111236664 [Lates japonicus]
MSVNSSSSALLDFHCKDSGYFISVALLVTKVSLLLPLLIFILYIGHQRWQRQPSSAATSHSDIFTYHLAAIELVFMLAIALYFCGSFTGLLWMTKAGFYVSALVIPGEICLHLLACVERYLAVVHPVTYMGLRQSAGVKIRNISIGCVWLLSMGWIGVTVLFSPSLPYIPFFCVLVFSLVVVSFCSVSVLRVLIRPGLGETSGDRERVDQSKQRAFCTVTAIMGVLWLYFVGFTVCLAVENSQLLGYSAGCLVLITANWMTLPSSLVLPLLFLHRAGKLFCCHCSNG